MMEDWEEKEIELFLSLINIVKNKHFKADELVTGWDVDEIECYILTIR